MKDFCEEVQSPASTGTLTRTPGWYINKPNKALSAAKGSIVSGSSNIKDSARHYNNKGKEGSAGG